MILKAVVDAWEEQEMCYKGGKALLKKKCLHFKLGVSGGIKILTARKALDKSLSLLEVG